MFGSKSSPTLDDGKPLGLTVHELPSALGPPPVKTSGRLKMLLVLLVCAAPIIASYFSYYVLHPQGQPAFGTLIKPLRPLPANLQHLRGQWLLISVASGACDAACEQNLYLQRQIRESLGKEKDRVDWVWLLSDAQEPRAALKPALVGATVLRLPEAATPWLEPALGQSVNQHLYVVDPMGNLMMRFPADLNTPSALKAKRDLERLLRASASWDEPGREVHHK